VVAGAAALPFDDVNQENPEDFPVLELAVVLAAAAGGMSGSVGCKSGGLTGSVDINPNELDDALDTGAIGADAKLNVEEEVIGYDAAGIGGGTGGGPCDGSGGGTAG
jgi:hypothetical protein